MFRLLLIGFIHLYFQTSTVLGTGIRKDKEVAVAGPSSSSSMQKHHELHVSIHWKEEADLFHSWLHSQPADGPLQAERFELSLHLANLSDSGPIVVERTGKYDVAIMKVPNVDSTGKILFEADQEFMLEIKMVWENPLNIPKAIVRKIFKLPVEEADQMLICEFNEKSKECKQKPFDVIDFDRPKREVTFDFKKLVHPVGGVPKIKCALDETFVGGQVPTEAGQLRFDSEVCPKDKYLITFESSIVKTDNFQVLLFTCDEAIFEDKNENIYELINIGKPVIYGKMEVKCKLKRSTEEDAPHPPPSPPHSPLDIHQDQADHVVLISSEESEEEEKDNEKHVDEHQQRPGTSKDVQIGKEAHKHPAGASSPTKAERGKQEEEKGNRSDIARSVDVPAIGTLAHYVRRQQQQAGASHHVQAVQEARSSASHHVQAVHPHHPHDQGVRQTPETGPSNQLALRPAEQPVSSRPVLGPLSFILSDFAEPSPSQAQQPPFNRSMSVVVRSGSGAGPSSSNQTASSSYVGADPIRTGPISSSSGRHGNNVVLDTAQQRQVIHPQMRRSSTFPSQAPMPHEQYWAREFPTIYATIARPPAAQNPAVQNPVAVEAANINAVPNERAANAAPIERDPREEAIQRDIQRQIRVWSETRQLLQRHERERRDRDGNGETDDGPEPKRRRHGGA